MIKIPFQIKSFNYEDRRDTKQCSDDHASRQVMRSIRFVVFFITLTFNFDALAADTLPQLDGQSVPQTWDAMWAGFDPRKEPMEVEVLKGWEEDGVVMRVIRYRVGVFKGERAMMAAVYGYPKGAAKLPGLVQIHGGGQYADYKAVITNAKRGYATISISWAGRISAPDYNVSPNIVKLFWEGKTTDSLYKVTTDWGSLDAYHAPSRSKKTSFPSVKASEYTLDAVDSPRNSPWFLCALGARRALTFLEQQPQVDPDRLGVYGHSMGGKLTVMTTAADSRVKAAAPSCGGISDRVNDSPLFRATIGDDAQLPRISCPIAFLSPANDFHGHINDLPKAVREIKSKQWRVICSPHHNHQDTAGYEVATQLWFDEHLKGTFSWPSTPDSELELKTPDNIPRFTVRPDTDRPVLSVDVFYTQQGIDTGERSLRENRIRRFWHYAEPVQKGDDWVASLPVAQNDKPIWVYANVKYALKPPVSGAGYYYRSYTAGHFNVSSLLQIATDEQVKAAGVMTTISPTSVIETFGPNWQKDWFSYRPENWPIRTNKMYHSLWKAPQGARLALDVRSDKANKMVIGIDAFAAEVKLNGDSDWQTFFLDPGDFHNAEGEALVDWNNIKELRLGDQETIRLGEKILKVGGPWKGGDPAFRNLRWEKTL